MPAVLNSLNCTSAKNIKLRSPQKLVTLQYDKTDNRSMKGFCNKGQNTRPQGILNIQKEYTGGFTVIGWDHGTSE